MRLQSARAQLSSAVSDEHKRRQNTQHQKNPSLRLRKNTPLESQKQIKREHLSIMDISADETFKSYLVHKVGPGSFIPSGGTTSAVDPFEVSAQIRQIRRPGLSSVLACRETSDPFVHVANVKFDRSMKLFWKLAVLFWSRGATKPARAKSNDTSEEKERSDPSHWLRPLPPLSNQLPLLLTLQLVMIIFINFSQLRL